jgi:hypothetical protein
MTSPLRQESDPAVAERVEAAMESVGYTPAETRAVSAEILHEWSPLEVDIVGGPPAFAIEFAVRLDRLRKRKCHSCGKRRIVYALRGYAGSVVISSSPLLCARCAKLVR